MMLNPRLKAVASKSLPHFLIAWLDPVQEIIDAEIRTAASEVRDGQIILDAGAGEARHRKLFTRGRYVALDAGTGDAAWDYSQLDVQGNLENLPVRDRSMDCVLCMVVLEHTRNPHLVLREFARVLKTNGMLRMVVPFLWEEHQIPQDYFRFTRYGVGLLLESLPFRIDILQPMGGFFWVCARRSINLLDFLQGGWWWILFALLAPLFGLLIPAACYFLDNLDSAKRFSLGFLI
jgi:SAM-dependent methyltransferase